MTQDVALRPAIDTFRRFNRTYTRFLGTLTDRYLSTDYSLAEGRVLYELALHPGAQAKDIAEALGLDRGYLSRILAAFTRKGLISRAVAKGDGRAANLRLTARGRAAVRTLNARADRQATTVLGGLTVDERTGLTQALEAVERAVRPGEAAGAITLRTHRPGDMGMVVHLEAMGYVQQFGWDGQFEALAARIVADFIERYDERRERCWVAERNGRHVGHVFLVRHPDEPGTAKLRLLYVDPSARGLGVGQRLVAECVAFARAAGYAKITLWTQSILTSAHRIYTAAGFRLVREEPHHSFGQDLIGQTWELALE